VLTHLQIRNFKAWRDTGPIRLAPLTVIFGTNSSGKSSLGHLLLALKQTALLADRKRALHLGDEHTLIDLGTFEDCLYGHDLQKTLDFTLRWRLPQELTVKDTLDRKKMFRGDELELAASLIADKASQPQTREFIYRLLQGDQEILAIRHARASHGKKASLTSEQFKLVHAQGRKWPLEPPEKFYRFADRTLSRYQNADFPAEFALETERLLQNIFYLGPLRSHPRRVYQWSGDTPPDVGAQGEYAIPALLAATEANRKLNRGKRQKLQRFDTFIAAWLKDLGVIENFSVKPVAEGRKEYEVLIRTHADTPEVKLTDVGFGVSQVLPALVQAFYAPPNAVVWMEQPEIHLHPSVQANLADTFISAVQAYENGAPRNVQIIIESHSEHFLTRLQRRVAERWISPDEVAIYFVHRQKHGAELEPLALDMCGNIANWPANFFGDEMADVAARTRAAMQHKGHGE
jgi:predicted ATPase